MSASIKRQSRATSALNKAIGRGDVEKVRQAIESGADVNFFRGFQDSFPIVRAASLWHACKNKPESQKAYSQIIEILLDSGADPLARDSGAVNTYYAIASEALRAHPAVINHVMPRIDQWASEQPKGGDTLKLLLMAIGRGGKLGDALLDALSDRVSSADEVGPWWWAAMEERSGHLMAYALDRFEPKLVPTGQWMRNYLGAGANIQSASGLITWLGSRPKNQQTSEVLGDGKQAGLMVLILKRIGTVSEQFWRHVLDQDFMLQEIKQRDLLRAVLVLSMKADTKQAQRVLKESLASGVNVAEVKARDALKIDPEMSAWKVRWADKEIAKKLMPQPEATLLETHLRRNDGQASITLCRKLIKAGVKPDFGALEALCSKMTYPAKDRALMKLFEEWTEAGGVDPMPEGKEPVWEQLPEQRTQAKAALQARYIQKKMDRNLDPSEPRPVVSRHNRVRM